MVVNAINSDFVNFRFFNSVSRFANCSNNIFCLEFVLLVKFVSTRQSAEPTFFDTYIHVHLKNNRKNVRKITTYLYMLLERDELNSFKRFFCILLCILIFYPIIDTKLKFFRIIRGINGSIVDC